MTNTPVQTVQVEVEKEPRQEVQDSGLSYLMKFMDSANIRQQLASGKTVQELEKAVRNKVSVMRKLTIIEKTVDGVREKVVACTADNFLKILEYDDHFRCVRFNLLRGVPEKHRKTSVTLWDDTDDAEARTYIEANYGLFNLQKYEDAFAVFQHKREYDPIQTRIGAAVWDGKPRAEMMLIRWLGAEDTPYNRECSRLLFAGGVNRAFCPGSKFDDVIVLIGPQGGGKSTFCQWLALSPELYSSVKTIRGQKGLEAIQGKWICEIEELLATLANDQGGTKSEENAKAFLSTASDFYRKPYAKRPTDSPRHCIFIGTTNRNEFLTDKTGNRRWYPVHVTADGHWLHDHEKECREDILQAWAEMKVAYDNGDPLSLPVANAEMLDEIRQQQSDAEQDDWREGLIEDYISGKERVCLLEVWQNALYLNRAPYFPDMKRKDSNELSTIIVNKLGWKRGNVERFNEFGKQKSFHNPNYDSESCDIL